MLKKLRRTGFTDRKKGSGRPKTGRTEHNIRIVEELILSQDDKPQSHKSTRQISRLAGIAQPTVVRIIHSDLKLKCLKKRRAQQLSDANRIQRLTCAKKLLAKYPENYVNFIWFTDEKVFTVATPKNPQNDRVYLPAKVKKRDVMAESPLRTRSTFSMSVMVSVGVSKVGLYTSHLY